MAVSFSSISGTAYPAWGFIGSFRCRGLIFIDLFLCFLGLRACELFKHLWDSLSCMAVSFSSISGTAYPAWGFIGSFRCRGLIFIDLFLGFLGLRACELFKHLWGSLSCMAVSFSSISGTAYPAWGFIGPFRCRGLIFIDLFLGFLGLRACELFKHLWGSLSCMAVSFSSISGTAYPAWL